MGVNAFQTLLWGRRQGILRIQQVIDDDSVPNPANMKRWPNVGLLVLTRTLVYSTQMSHSVRICGNVSTKNVNLLIAEKIVGHWICYTFIVYIIESVTAFWF